MNKNSNTLNWFEIPVTNFERAKKFYESIFGIQLESQEMGGAMMGFFPYEPGSGKLSGAICAGEWYKPSQDGALLYLNGDPNLQTVLDKIAGAGGQVIMPKTQISPEIGYFAIFIDSEGNRLALHSNG